MNNDIEAVLDYCQDEKEWESFVEYLLENDTKVIELDELNDLKEGARRFTELLEKEALGNPECNHIWARAARARVALKHGEEPDGNDGTEADHD